MPRSTGTTPTPLVDDRRTMFAHGALAGLLAAAAAVGAAELTAGALAVSSIVVSVGEAVIELTPAGLAEAAIDALGGLNRPGLVTGTLILLALLSSGVGLLAIRNFWVGATGMVTLGTVGMAASVLNPLDGLPEAVVPGLVATVVGTASLWWASRLRLAETATGTGTGTGTEHHRGVAPGRGPQEDAGAGDHDRRVFLKVAGTLSVAAAVMVAGGRWLQARTGAAAERLRLALPSPDLRAPTAAGADLDIDGLSPFFTPNGDFYRIDTALLVPEVRAQDWRLRIHGMVDQERVLTFGQLVNEHPLEEHDITLTCVSNEVGGELVDNARWLGVRLEDVLTDVRISEEADQLVPRSIDGYTGGFPVADALDGRDALLAVGMNGEPLPMEHGYPVRLVVPGLYGYVSAVKWLSELEFTTFDAFDQYWVRRNWAERAPVKTQSRIDVPRPASEVPAGAVIVAGVAWAQGRGISMVEVQVEGGAWRAAELAEAPDEDTWRQWRTTVQVEAGARRIRVRATDGAGATQTEERLGPLPDGAEGWHTIEIEAT